MNLYFSFQVSFIESIYINLLWSCFFKCQNLLWNFNSNRPKSLSCFSFATIPKSWKAVMYVDFSFLCLIIKTHLRENSQKCLRESPTLVLLAHLRWLGRNNRQMYEIRFYFKVLLTAFNSSKRASCSLLILNNTTHRDA